MIPRVATEKPLAADGQYADDVIMTFIVRISETA